MKEKTNFARIAAGRVISNELKVGYRREEKVKDTYILKIEDLSKTYGRTKVVDNFNMTVEPGHIYGLIGPNGAGKTTIMKILAGLVLPDGGRITMFGESENLDIARTRCGFMIEAPYLDPSMTARQNMEYMRILRGVADSRRIDELLEYVGLANTGKKIVRRFSLGMKQRLGIAMALLASPELIVLDEPVNGLDPEGIVEIRNMLTKLAAEQGIPIIISSHLLAELSELCTDFTILDKGKLVESLTREELENKCRSYIAVKTDNVHILTTVVEQKLGIREYKILENDEMHIYEKIDDIETISRTITDAGLTITRLNPEGESLEQYYLSKVSSDGSPADGSGRRVR